MQTANFICLCLTVSFISFKYEKQDQDRQEEKANVSSTSFSVFFNRLQISKDEFFWLFTSFHAIYHNLWRTNQALLPAYLSNDKAWFIKPGFYSACIRHGQSVYQQFKLDFVPKYGHIMALAIPFGSQLLFQGTQIICRLCAISGSPRISQANQSISKRVKYLYLGKWIDCLDLVHDSMASLCMWHLSFVFWF